MTRKSLYILSGVSLLTAVLLAVSCSSSSPEHQAPQDYYQTPQQAPQVQGSYPSQPGGVIVQPQQSSGLQDMLLGGLIGHAMANRNGSSDTHTVERVVERPRYIPTPRPYVRPEPPRPVITPPRPAESKGLQNFRSGNWGSSAPKPSSSLSQFKGGNWGSVRRK
jgi:hypothetical protein